MTKRELISSLIISSIVEKVYIPSNIHIELPSVIFNLTYHYDSVNSTFTFYKYKGELIDLLTLGMNSYNDLKELYDDLSKARAAIFNMIIMKMNYLNSPKNDDIF